MCGGMVDAADSKSAVGNYVWVQVPSHAPLMNLFELFDLLDIYQSEMIDFFFLKEKNSPLVVHTFNLKLLTVK